jgi:nucleotide-binding universal stress UspA family protein
MAARRQIGAATAVSGRPLARRMQHAFGLTAVSSRWRTTRVSATLGLMLGLAEGTAVPRSVVCGVDGTDESRDAALVAAAMAHALDARLMLVYVAHGPPVWSGGDASVEVRRHEVAIETCTASLVALAGALGLNDAVLRVAFGDPTARLLALCNEEQAALLVVGSRGGSALATALIDGVCVSHRDGWRVPVVIVPRNAGVTGLLPDADQLTGRREPLRREVRGSSGSGARTRSPD